MTVESVSVNSDRFLTTNEVSSLYSIPTATLRYWRHVGAGPASFKRGARVIYRLSSVEKWLTNQEAATTRGGVA
ncbi:helix-turn-helix domain-containing protein [Rhodococcus sp. IEGM 1330]|uniref:helix-turn-helix transcriptional regulator n=1 Tax=Rhodococcus sp. IEGM 1330 TaxID=3082225 RepID=UPI0029545144|nr:helix-turn-helix domain-containing protein [Rhodococcus sp. IEGM 1330]MDV8021998.1 helix-turn-helix domain-containing protein [Rhodococcus sp. IEGM 1330]